MKQDRFDYSANRSSAMRYRERRNALWPPAPSYQLHCLDLSAEWPWPNAGLSSEFQGLRDVIEAEWQSCKKHGSPGRTRFHDHKAVAHALRQISGRMGQAVDRRALDLRASAVEHDYNDTILTELAQLNEETTVIAGQLSTWYGKHVGGAPTAFACRCDEAAQKHIETALQYLPEVEIYLKGIHANLLLAEVPAFAPKRLFFMAGEGNLHPKHIAYFLPEDEGVKRSPFKKTFYFVNTHHALIDSISLPLARKLMELDKHWPTSATHFDAIPALGVLAHEVGHFVYRSNTTFNALNSADRWASVVMQEVVADVFSLLIVAEVIGPRLGLCPEDIVAYHLAESLRYIDRGLGFFPDSDGMYLQLSYLASFGIFYESKSTGRWTARAESVIAAYRSLARVLADTLLAGNVETTLVLYNNYAPPGPNRLANLQALLAESPMKSLEYVQEPLHSGEHDNQFVNRAMEREIFA
jgi:hypothetical protein